jgi:hypothetical protein
MNIPGFTAESAMQRTKQFYATSSSWSRGAASVRPAAARTCRPGSTTACPIGSYCTEPGSWPFCRCLQCFGGSIGQGGWNWDDGGWD